MEQKKLKHKRRTYELTLEIPHKDGIVVKKVKFRAIDSIHASAMVMRMFGKKKKVKVTSAVLVREE